MRIEHNRIYVLVSELSGVQFSFLVFPFKNKCVLARELSRIKQACNSVRSLMLKISFKCTAKPLPCGKSHPKLWCRFKFLFPPRGCWSQNGDKSGCKSSGPGVLLWTGWRLEGAFSVLLSIAGASLASRAHALISCVETHSKSTGESTGEWRLSAASGRVSGGKTSAAATAAQSFSGSWNVDQLDSRQFLDCHCYYCCARRILSDGPPSPTAAVTKPYIETRKITLTIC